MSTRGFEFAYMLDGGNATPLIRDFFLGEVLAHKVGDLVTMESDGFMDLADKTDGTVFGVMQEAVGTADITEGTTLAKVAIITRNQVWRCSMDAGSTTHVVGYSKIVDLTDHNTLDSDGSLGYAVLVGIGPLDDDGSVIAYILFADTAFGNV